MASQDYGKQKKRGRPPGRSVGSATSLRLKAETEDALDAASAKEKDQPSRAEMIRRTVERWLTDHGFLKPPPLDPAALTDKIADLDAKAAALKHDGSKSPANALKTMKRAVVKNEATKLRNKLAKAKGAKA